MGRSSRDTHVQGSQPAGARANETNVRGPSKGPVPFLLGPPSFRIECMMGTLSQLNPSPRVLLGPGPSDVHPRVLAAMGTPLLGHLDPQLLEIMNETQELLRKTFRTANRLTFPVSGTGSAGMETCVVNLIEPGERMVVCINGVFGQRMKDVAERAGAVVTALEKPWGDVFGVDELRQVLQKVRPKVLGIVHAE